MGKSSSLKKKRSKNSSQSRMRKKNKVKIKKSKSKKLRRRRDDSVSDSGDSDSTSTVSVSSSSSKDHYRSRKSRSRSRNDVKVGKKSARRRSSSRESSEDSPHVKKRKGSRRDDSRKRTGKKKMHKRDDSVSSRSSRSLSYSTCPSDSDEIGYEKRRGRSEKKEKYGRSEKVKRGNKRSRGRSRSSSSCSRHNEGSDHSIEERMMEESNSRRLKSIITVVKQENENSRELITDEPKEDVYDDDYPSCRSNDSNDGCTRREIRQNPHTISETKRLPDEQVEVSNIGTSNVEEINVWRATGGLNGDDIESILRQRALENLKKFRGLQRNINPPITSNDSNVVDVKIPSSVKTDPFQIKALKADDSKLVTATQVSQHNRQPQFRRGSSTLPKNDSNASHKSDDGKYSETLGSDVASLSPRALPTGVSRTEVNTAINTVSSKPKLVLSQTGLEAPNTHTTQKQAASAQEPSQAKFVAETSIDEGDLETTRIVKPSEENASVSNKPKSVKLRRGLEPPNNTYNAQKQESAALESCQAKLVAESRVNESSLRNAQIVNTAECGNPGDSTCEKPSSSETIRADKQEDETKDNLQQKTMSVMRGGEVVQVSYKVYIPKKAPALARRQLKR